MKKLVVAMVTLVLLAGCDAQPPQRNAHDELVDEVYRAVVKYEFMYGTPEEQKRAPITNKQVAQMKEYMKGVTDSGQ